MGFRPPKASGLAGTLVYSTVLAIEQIAHRLPAGSIGSFVALPPIARVPAGIGGVFLTALRTAICKPGFPRLQFEFFPTNHASFDRKCHDKLMIIEVARALLPGFIATENHGRAALHGRLKDEVGRIQFLSLRGT